MLVVLLPGLLGRQLTTWPNLATGLEDRLELALLVSLAGDGVSAIGVTGDVAFGNLLVSMRTLLDGDAKTALARS
jgi:hypothetical protein